MLSRYDWGPCLKGNLDADTGNTGRRRASTSQEGRHIGPVPHCPWKGPAGPSACVLDAQPAALELTELEPCSVQNLVTKPSRLMHLCVEAALKKKNKIVNQCTSCFKEGFSGLFLYILLFLPFFWRKWKNICLTSGLFYLPHIRLDWEFSDCLTPWG